MSECRAMVGLAAALLLFAGKAMAEEKAKEPIAEIQIGAAGEWGLSGGGSSFGPAVAVEVTAIEHWLEIEAGVMSLFSRGRQSGAPISYSKSLGLCPKPWNLWSVSGRDGGIRPAAGKLPTPSLARLCSISSSGHGRSESSVGL